ncbi:MAG: hypothetical protein CMF12_13745 [Idiomarina sp.]|uniref:hypothetical protein n=1 Tax=Idiomarina sp. TaxID=1874361 RepID=UPI000C36768D|nr:hypothetical protein [Idiomarina sp.]MBT43569.1 hypothetical protein [Idiomarina sp.]
MAQVYLSKQQADNLATLIGYWLDSSYEADENDVPDNIIQQHIELGIKAIEAGADIGSSHSYVVDAYGNQPKKKRRKKTPVLTDKPAIEAPRDKVLYRFMGDSLLVRLPNEEYLLDNEHLAQELSADGFRIKPNSDELTCHLTPPFQYKKILYGESALGHTERYEAFYEALIKDVLEPLSMTCTGKPDNLFNDEHAQFVCVF